MYSQRCSCNDGQVFLNIAEKDRLIAMDFSVGFLSIAVERNRFSRLQLPKYFAIAFRVL